jgi:hypothetical protein
MKATPSKPVRRGIFRKSVVVAIGVVVLAAIALYANRERFQRGTIQITHRLHRTGGRFDDPSGVAPILFELDRSARITSIKVVLASEIANNKYAHPLWHLVANARTAPIRGFLYGMELPGMRTAVKDATAEPLTMGPTYRLLVEAGSLKTQYDFDLASTFRVQ